MALYTVPNEGVTQTISCSINMSTETGQVFQISQAISTAARYATAMNGIPMSNVTVIYPYSTNSDTCSYINEYSTIYINKNNCKTYRTWDTIMHEYGHHVQYEINIINSPGGSHSSSQNDEDVYYISGYTDAKDRGVRIAWGESWPTVFGIMAQQKYISNLSNIEYVGDSYYSSHDYGTYCGLQYNVETTLSNPYSSPVTLG